MSTGGTAGGRAWGLARGAAVLTGLVPQGDAHLAVRRVLGDPEEPVGVQHEQPVEYAGALGPVQSGAAQEGAELELARRAALLPELPQLRSEVLQCLEALGSKGQREVALRLGELRL